MNVKIWSHLRVVGPYPFDYFCSRLVNIKSFNGSQEREMRKRATNVTWPQWRDRRLPKDLNVGNIK